MSVDVKEKSRETWGEAQDGEVVGSTGFEPVAFCV